MPWITDIMNFSHPKNGAQAEASIIRKVPPLNHFAGCHNHPRTTNNNGFSIYAKLPIKN